MNRDQWDHMKQQMDPSPALLEKTRGRLQEQKAALRRFPATRVCALAVCLAGVALLAGYFLFRPAPPALPLATVPLPSFGPPSSGEQGASPSSEENTSPGGSIPYSSLRFSPSVPLPSSTGPGQSVSADIAAFDEAMMGDAEALAEGTVVHAYFKEYRYDTASDKFEEGGVLHHQWKTLVCEFRIDRIIAGETELSPGQTIKVETDCTNGCYFTEEPAYPLQVGRRYILPLLRRGPTLFSPTEEDPVVSGDITRDGEYDIVYPFAPQIEVTLDGEYLFHNQWTSLWDETTPDVSTDGNSAFAFKLRTGEGFLEDLRALFERARQ